MILFFVWRWYCLIKIKVSDMLGKHKMSRRKLSDLTGIRPNTIGAFYNETIQRIDVDSLDKICKVFNCKIEEIIEYIPDEFNSNNSNLYELNVAEDSGNYKIIDENKKE